jgi:hypothetical protein
MDDAIHYIKWLPEKYLHESIYFYTFHKCASTLFSGYVLKNVEGLRHVDYASKIYTGKMANNAVFNNKGFIYGPLRLSLQPSSKEFTLLVKYVSDTEFVKDKIAIFLIRDPRDILVSKYYSFRFTHGLSPVKKIRETQQRIRKDIQSKSINQYCIDEAPKTLDEFKTLRKLNQSCSRSVLLKYEDMIENWDLFSANLTKYIVLKEKKLAKIYGKTRPRSEENLTSHRRDGRPGDFRKKLREDTIKSLNKTFKDILEEYQYIV